MSPPPFRELVKTLLLSNMAYFDQIEDVTRVIGYPQVKFFAGSLLGEDTQCYVMFEGRTAFVIFRGTEDASDFINDIEAVRWASVTFDPNIKVHKGFHLQYQAVASALSSYLTEHAPHYDEVVFTGHSLGGALATIATMYYYWNNQDAANPASTHITKVIRTQTFGCPRVGDANFGQYYSKCLLPENHWRVFNETDPAAQFPSQTALLSSDIYFHVPGNALCVNGTSPVTCEVGQEDNGVSLPWDFIIYLGVHHTKVYMARLLPLADPSLNPPPPVATDPVPMVEEAQVHVADVTNDDTTALNGSGSESSERSIVIVTLPDGAPGSASTETATPAGYCVIC
jgi:hypothetical protein